ncbi:type II toxin-antitoxin system VapC family toxin [Candidatus Woesearchaeota archaeon]|nr:type II toxin-antitoxin system VapC family toxin [Candidatus Woesearchaeota archaeon]
MIAIDANVFLEVILGQERKDECKEFLKKIQSGQVRAIISGFNISSIALVMRRKGSSMEDIGLFLRSLARYEGLWKYPPMFIDQVKAMELAALHKLDFDDALTLRCALATDCYILITLDADFDAVNAINVSTPGEFLKSLSLKKPDPQAAWGRVLDWQTSRTLPKEARQKAKGFKESLKMRPLR